MPKLIHFIDDMATDCHYRFRNTLCCHPKDESLHIKNDEVICCPAHCPRCVDPYEPDDTLYMPIMEGVTLPEGMKLDDIKYYDPDNPYVIYPRPGIRKILPFPVLSNGKTNKTQ